ncbi:unnamed protein product [Arabidopsis lyrata]|uniref:MATH domain-containing protein n=1 Tax=Arabidopsis lyrata subsp. lyrata TaxID=81972 RepID=D7L8P4_ARALL|nr:MATH domain and coiled-coil domain-containing protein At3g58280 [Arabidopsis lyrata subsp. lyrata]EFH59953.1 hypothetical protein ARALYDRAFT_899344 [Arabidopsis lyrata subsp. lyrata]CAH8261982.1 unnamed protein product [Arabidopsis lyrata]|eukprot:XP_002883694.1 MATH domain and coiled-coil domain-containing protein At3g58280 [Arabidopsis lyrata subsp. lyrata]
MSKIVESKSTLSYPSTSHFGDFDTDETVNINGFWICRSQLGQAKLIFKEHPETASNFCLKSFFAKETYLTALLNLIDKMNMLSLQSLSKDDLKEVDNTILDLEAAGFKLDWLKKKFEEIRVIVKKAQDREARMRELDRKIRKKMHELVVLEDKMKKEQLEAKSEELGYYYDFFI